MPESEGDTLSVADAAAILGITQEAVYFQLKSAGMEPSVPGGKGRGKGARLSRAQVEQLRAIRIARLEEELRQARGEE